MKLKTSFSTLSCPDWSFSQIVQRGHAAGYDGVELRLLERETNLLAHPQLQESQLPIRRRELEEAGFRVCGVSSSVAFHSPDRAERQRQLETGRRYLELAANLGAEWIRVFGDVLQPIEGGGSVPVEQVSVEQRERTLQQVIDGLEELGEYAEPLKLGVIIETHGDFASSPLMGAVMNEVRSPAVGVLWDTHHPWRFCGEPVAETFERLRPFIRHTHWKDSVAFVPAVRAESGQFEQSAGTTGVRAGESQPSGSVSATEMQAVTLMSGHRPAHYVLFGEGEFPALDCLRLLWSMNYSGWFCLEWEKMWHPELVDPEVALPQFIKTLAAMERVGQASRLSLISPSLH